MRRSLAPSSILTLIAIAMFVVIAPASTPSAIAHHGSGGLVEHDEHADAHDASMAASVVFRMWVLGLRADEMGQAAAVLRNPVDGMIDGGPMAVSRVINEFGDAAIVLASDQLFVDGEGEFAMQAGARVPVGAGSVKTTYTDVGRVLQARIEATTDEIGLALRFEASGVDGSSVGQISFDYEGDVPSNRTMIAARQWVPEDGSGRIYFLIVRADVVESNEG